MKKIVISEGCTAFYTTVDGKMIDGEENQNVMSEKEQDELIDYLLLKAKEQIKNGSIAINSLIQLFQYDDWESDSICDQCGDQVTRTYYNI
jgi:hypothetical protein